MIQLWIDGRNWCYNEAVARLNDGREPKASWKGIKTAIIHAVPRRLESVPYQVKSIGVRDACKAMSAVKKYNKQLAAEQKAGRRLDEDFAELSFHSRKAPKQGCFIPGRALSPNGAYHTLLGQLRMAETLPEQFGDSRLTRHNGQYHLSVSHPVQRRIAETQGRVVALDPGIRSFLSFYSEEDAGHIGKGDFARITRLCLHLDDLLSRAKLEKQRLRKRNLYRAAARLRVKIGNLVKELHHQSARALVDNYDLILLPTFNTSEMALRGRRKLRRKSVRSLLTFSHYQFQQFLIWKAWQTGKQLLLVNESYTSKTCSWSGEIIPNLGGRKVVRGSDGIAVDRDLNGARGIFLRALGDTPGLLPQAQASIGNGAALRGSVC